MIDLPRVSVLMPVRDAGSWLRESIESVLAQTESRFELLAVDDASSDASRAILEEYAASDGRVRILETPAGSHGIVAALNLALHRARAALVARMDADDLMLPRRLELQLEAMARDQTLFGVSSLVGPFPDDAVSDGMRDYLRWQNSLRTPEEIARDRFVESPVVHPSVMLRTQVVRDVLGGWRDTAWPEDWDFFLRAFEAGLRIARAPELLLHWRQHGAQLTRSHGRYGEAALLEARASFLSRHLAPLVADGRELWILGAGPVGKTLVKALARHGTIAAAMADVDPRKIGGIVRGEQREWRVLSHETMLGRRPRVFGISAVAGAEARARIREELTRHDWHEEADFLVAA